MLEYLGFESAILLLDGKEVMTFGSKRGEKFLVNIFHVTSSFRAFFGKYSHPFSISKSDIFHLSINVVVMSLVVVTCSASNSFHLRVLTLSVLGYFGSTLYWGGTFFAPP